MATRSVVIVGAGMSGLTAALTLQERGWRVDVLDQGTVPHPDAASTDVSKVVRMDYGSDELYTGLGERALAGWDIWNTQWERPLFHRTGFLILASGERMMPGGFESASFTTLSKRGHRLVRVHREDLASRYQVWNAERYGDGYFNPNAGWAESGAVVAKLSQLCRSAGVAVHEHAPFAAFIERGATVRGVRTQQGTEHRADHVVFAVGAWTPFLLPELRPLLRVSGHAVLLFKPDDPARFRSEVFPVWAADIAKTGRYGFPANADGVVKLARHDRGVDIRDPAQPRVVSGTEIEAGREFLRDSLPSLATAPMAGTRQCWYGDSADGDFLIDHHPDRPGLVVVGGDSGHAFKFAPVLGALIADVLEQKPHIAAGRFRWRQPRPGQEPARAS